MIRRLAVGLLASCCTITAVAQQKTDKPMPPWTVLVDPVCPVSAGYSRISPITTKELRILYFPAAKDAQIKTAEALTLQVGFNSSRWANNSASIPLTRKGDYWEAIIPLEKRIVSYAIFYFADKTTGAVDDNHGQFWDIVFCAPSGDKDPNSVIRRAESYTGARWPGNIRRQTDYANAVSILEAELAANKNFARSGMLLESLWSYKAERDGGDAKAWAKVAAEAEQFVTAHQDDKPSLYAAGNFIVRYADKFAADFLERMISVLDARISRANDSYRAQVEYGRAVRVRDPHQRLAALDKFVASYPATVHYTIAQESRFNTFVELGDVQGAETAFAKYREAVARQPNDVSWGNDHYEYLALARLYLEKGVKYKEALKLVDEAQAKLKTEGTSPEFRMDDEFRRSAEGECAEVSALAHLKLKRPDLALAEAQKAATIKKSAPAYSLLAESYAATGDKAKALDAYFEAALLPSNDDLQYRSDLERYFLNNFGTQEQLDAAFTNRRAERFTKANYVPKLVNESAPPLEFVTIKGERFDRQNLQDKAVVVNFWSPG